MVHRSWSQNATDRGAAPIMPWSGPDAACKAGQYRRIKRALPQACPVAGSCRGEILASELRHHELAVDNHISGGVEMNNGHFPGFELRAGDGDAAGLERVDRGAQHVGVELEADLQHLA